MRRKSQWLLGIISLPLAVLVVFSFIVAAADAWPWSDQARERNGSNMSSWERYWRGLDRQGRAARRDVPPPRDNGPLRPLPPEPDYTGRWRR